MMIVKRNIFLMLGMAMALAVAAFLVQSCGIYSFTGTSIQPDVKTVVGTVVGYDVRATAITASEQAAQNRLTVSVKVSFTNRKYPEESFPEKSFSAYADFDATQTLDAVEATLCEEIVEKLCEDIFNGTVANW